MKFFVVVFVGLIVGCNVKPPVVDPVPPVIEEPATDNEKIVAEVVAIHNANRSSSVVLDGKLTDAAQKHAEWMAENSRMSHTGEGRSKPSARIKDAGYNWSTYGENVAWGQKSPEHVMRVWLGSPPHRRNIKNGSFNDIGVGFAKSSNGSIYWCVTFGATGLRGDGDYGTDPDSEDSTPPGIPDGLTYRRWEVTNE